MEARLDPGPKLRPGWRETALTGASETESAESIPAP